jgi:glutathione peroxidase-family protein
LSEVIINTTAQCQLARELKQLKERRKKHKKEDRIGGED